MKSTQDKNEDRSILNLKLDLEEIHASLFSGIQALTERLSKIPQQCEI